MKTPNGKYSCKNGYLQIVIHRGRASACGEKFTVMTDCNTFGKRPCGWGAQKPCVIRAEARIDFTSLTRSVFTCSKRLLFEHPYYRKFTGTCGCNPKYLMFASMTDIQPDEFLASVWLRGKEYPEAKAHLAQILPPEASPALQRRTHH